MSLRRLGRNTAVAAASTALAAGALVAAGTTAASAAEASNTYTCSVPGLYSGDIPVTVTGGFPAQAWAGWTVPADLLAGQAVAAIPEDARGLLQMVGVDGARTGDFALQLGSADVPMPATGAFSEDYSTWTGAATNGEFTTPTPGTYDVTMPESFTFTTTKDGVDSATLACQLAEGQEPASLGQVEVLRQSSTVTAPRAVKAKKGKVAKVKVSVATDTGAASGKVVATKGKKVLGTARLRDGAATLKLGKLPVGKHRVVVAYAGNKSVKGDTAKVTVKVTR